MSKKLKPLELPGTSKKDLGIGAHVVTLTVPENHWKEWVAHCQYKYDGLVKPSTLMAQVLIGHVIEGRLK
jgi:hypothetical protein